MSARDELAGLVNRADWTARSQTIADAILAAGYRKPRTITTAEELDELPENTAIIGTSWEPKLWPGTPYVKLSNGEWHEYGNDYSVGSDDILLPATITFEPESQS